MSAAPHGEGGAVCCMCGDHGLRGELFRCRSCRARLQHRYCSDLYPRAAAYRRCNWCLLRPRAPADQGVAVAVAVAVAAASLAEAGSSKSNEKRKTTTAPASAEEEEEERRRHDHEAAAGCSASSPRRSPRAGPELGHCSAKKKQRAGEEIKAMPQPAAAAVGKESIVTGATPGSGSGSGKEVMRAGKTRVNRVRVRRYKLLTEVISC